MGASNYVLKNNLIRLPFSVLEALRKRDALLGQSKALMFLQESESRLNAIANAAGDGIIMIDNDGLISFWNPSAERIFGFSRSEAIGQNLHSLIVPERYRKDHNTSFPEFQLKGTGSAVGKTLELSGLHKKGHEIVISLTLSAVQLQDKWHAVGNVRDISDQKRVESELIAAKERAEASDKLKTAFINNISHEVRTPLNGILGFSELITLEENTPEDRDQYKSLIKISSTRLLNTITNYMDIALLMSGNMVVRPTLFSLHQQLKSLYELYAPVCKVKNLKFRLIIPESIEELKIFSDRELHCKAISHLIDNAVKFTHSGEIYFGYFIENKKIEYYINDTGVGISPDMQERVFENFRQGEVSNTRDYEGSGLGLSISRGMIKLLGGDITLVSSKGVGTRMSFTIAYPQVDIYYVQPEPSIINYKSSGIILLAEDDLTNFLLQEKILKKAGFLVVPAYNGQEAVEQCLKNPAIAAVLMDLKMPVMDGFEATRKIKAHRPDLPVIAVTAFAMSGDEKKALEAGCDQYLTKPLMDKDLMKLLHQYGILPVK
jgi:PAS domain S-box-containing protein